MKVLSVSVTLCTILTLSRAFLLNPTLQTGRCQNESQNCSSLFGSYCPQCDPNGNFLPQQCSGSTGYCWCVNITSGNEIPDTRTPPGTKSDCGLCKEEQHNCSTALGAFCPQCDSNENFLPKQCSGSTGYCWCVDILSGKMLPNTNTPPGNQTVCGLCKEEQQNCSNESGVFCPQCDRNGNFLPKQCSGSTGYCWCVDIISGKKLSNTTTPPGNQTVCGFSVGSEEDTESEEPEGPAPVCDNCGLCKEEQQHCRNMPGAFCPKCDPNGNFLPLQCSGSTGYCWCVNIISGKEIPNTLTPPGRRPDCDFSEGSEEDTETLPEGPDKDSHDCPKGWVQFGNRCFIFIHTPKPWIDAEVYCQFEGANLASVHCEKGNRFIMSLTRGDTHNFPQTWLGGFDAIHPGYWMWSDGSQFDYENWYENDEDDDEHDNHNKHDNKKNCLRMNYELVANCPSPSSSQKSANKEATNDESGEKKLSLYDLKWFHASCTDSLPFVCAKSILTPPDHPM